MEDHRPREIVFVRVIDDDEELAVLQAIKATVQTDAKFAPVLDRLVSTVCRLATTHGYASRIVGAREFLANPSRRIPRRVRKAETCPDTAILALAGVDQHAIMLAEHLLGGSAISELGRADEFLSLFRRAVVLFCPQTPTDEVCRVLKLLVRQDISYSVLPTDSSDSGRLSLLKALLFPQVEIRGLDQINGLSSQHADAQHFTSLESNTNALGDPSNRILVLSGHGNSVDLGGGGIVICPRGDSTPRDDMTRLYPCFGDGHCFRQPLFGRSPTSTDGLINPALFRHSVVLLLGCGTFPIGDNPFHLSSTILWRMAGSDALATVATLGVFFHDLNVETALISLLLEGYEFGEAVRAFNAWHRRAYGPTSPAKENYGPVLAVGHPGLRLNSYLIHTLGSAAVNIEDFPISIRPDASRFSDDGFSIFKLRSAPAEQIISMALETPPSLKGAAVSIVPPHHGDQESIFVMLRSGDSPCPERAAELLPLRRQNFECDLAMLHDSLSHLAFWRLLLTDANSPIANTLGHEGKRLIAEIASLELEPLLLGYFSACPFETAGVLPASPIMVAHKLVMNRWSVWQRLLLEAVRLYVQHSGGFLFHAWQKLYRRGCGEDHDEVCPSCLREIHGLLYRSQINPSDQHRIIHCPVCGVLGELPPAIAIHIIEPIRSSRGNDTLTVGFAIRSERPAPLHGFVSLIRESWFHAGYDTAEPIELAVDRDCTRQFSIAISISPGTSPGLYPLTLIGIVNGGLIQIRYHLPILTSSIN
jgi:hypothetical protein